MKICYLDAFSGISGDMTVGALADAGANENILLDTLRSLGAGASFRLEKTKRGSLAATKFHVEDSHSGHHHHRHLSHILEMIDKAQLPEKAKKNAASVFQRLGQAEAKVHGVEIEKVHFHEVGAADSIADIVGACLGFELLGIECIYCSAINVGSGTVDTEHGILPVPAPATAALLEGRPIYSRGPQKELTTPTGAAIASTLSVEFGALPPMNISAIGHGAGGHDFSEQPNVLRVLVGDDSHASEATTVTIIEANIDDSNPEVLGYAMEKLLETGALDVSLSPLLMKKNRPGTLVRIISRREDQESLAKLLVEETTTFGVRLYSAERRVLARKIVEVTIPYGKVRIKVSDDGRFAPGI